MKQPSAFVAITATLLLVGLVAPAGEAIAQGNKSIAGTYSAVSSVATDASGKKTDTYGANPRGQLILSPDGNYSLTLARRDLPKFASGSRTKGTPDENAAVVGGSITHFGKYNVADDGKTLTFHIQTSSYPNWDGTKQERPFTMKGGMLTYKVAASSGGGTGEVSWKRIK